MALDESESPVAPVTFTEAPGNYVASISENGKLLLVQLTELKYQPKGRGLVLMGLDKDEKLVAVTVSDQPTLTVIGLGRTGKEKEVTLGKKEIGHYASTRSHKGRVLPEKMKPMAFKARPKLELNG
jgi:topoisomerase-4 subunit A